MASSWTDGELLGELEDESQGKLLIAIDEDLRRQQEEQRQGSSHRLQLEREIWDAGILEMRRSAQWLEAMGLPSGQPMLCGLSLKAPLPDPNRSYVGGRSLGGVAITVAHSGIMVLTGDPDNAMRRIHRPADLAPLLKSPHVPSRWHEASLAEEAIASAERWEGLAKHEKKEEGRALGWEIATGVGSGLAFLLAPIGVSSTADIALGLGTLVGLACAMGLGWLNVKHQRRKEAMLAQANEIREDAFETWRQITADHEVRGIDTAVIGWEEDC